MSEILDKQIINFNTIKSMETMSCEQKVYKSVKLEAKNAPYGSYAAGCRSNYGDGGGEDCYICDYGG